MSEIKRKRLQAGVDVAVPCYQYGRFLRECVASVLNQDLRNVRVLIIDNASTDNSVEVAQQLAAEDRRVEVVAHRRNLGQHASFNEGIDWARSSYFLILCADDLLAPGALARAVTVMQRRPDVHLTYGRALGIQLDKPFPRIGLDEHTAEWSVLQGRELLERFCRTGRNHIRGPTAIVRTSVQKHVGYYRPELPHKDDFELWMRFSRVGNVAETDAWQGIYRSHLFNQCATVSDIHEWNLHFEAAFESFFRHEGAFISDSRPLQRLARKSLAERAYWCAFSALCRGQIGTCLNLLKFAVRLRPSTAILPPLSYLLHREDTVRRILSIASEVVGVSRGSAGPGPDRRLKRSNAL
jgi:glycosyltransferase involved in cell wall biosynthesis